MIDGISDLSANSSVPTVASARDIGNIAAGYVAGSNGLPWDVFRWKADALESRQMSHPAVEGQTTQQAQKLGYVMGKYEYRRRQAVTGAPPGWIY